jgi:NADPH-dependent curcumin reductase CurA
MDDRKSYAKPLQIGDVMTGEGVARVIASNRPDYSVGDIVLAQTGWRTHALSNGAGVRKLDPAAAPVTTALGVLGMPGFTAYSGLRSIGRPKPGETVVVAAASGPVGSLVGQLAKLAGARAIGIAGGPPKCAYVKNELQFDAAIDHRAADFPAQLARACPKGIDVYFRKCRWRGLAGGTTPTQQFRAGTGLWPNRPIQRPRTGRRQGSAPGDHARNPVKKSDGARFIYSEFVEQHYPEFLREVGAAIAEGRIRYREDIVDGLERAPEAFIGLLDGKNFGKLIVRVTD